MTDTHPAQQPDQPVESMSQLNELLAWFDGLGKMIEGAGISGMTESEETSHDNTRRAGFGATAMVALAEYTGMLSERNDEEPATVLHDLLADLRHLADAVPDLDFDYENERAAECYQDELKGLI